MKLGLDVVSVEALKEFADKLEGVSADFAEGIQELYRECATLVDDLGVHQEAFEQLLTGVGRSANDFRNIVGVLAPRMRECADAIYAFIIRSGSFSDDAPQGMGTRVRTIHSMEQSVQSLHAGSAGGLEEQLIGHHRVAPISFGIPRDLGMTLQPMTERPGGGKTYNTPSETGEKLDSRQGKVNGYQGTCGLCSCENILRLAGLDISEKDVVQFAVDNGLCVTGRREDENGGTSYEGRQTLLEAFGISSSLLPQSIMTIEQAVTSGKGVIISVDAGMLWKDDRYRNGLHAVTVTSVDYAADGSIENFHICDSGYGSGNMVVSAAHLQKALAANRKMNVTHQTIR